MSVTGSRYRYAFTGYRDTDGMVKLRSNGRIDQYAIIQADRESTDINVILSKYANGDATVLSRMQTLYGDFTGLPDSYIGMVNMIEEARRQFDDLPPAVKNIFGNDFTRMMNNFDTDLAAYSDSLAQIAPGPAENTKDDGGILA